MRQKPIKLFFLTVILMLLTGCSVSRFETTVYISELSSYEETKSFSELHIEVPSCHHYKDIYKDSTILKKAKIFIPDIFKDAEYVECIETGIGDTAVFKLPLYINGGTDGNNFITINKTKDNLLSLFIPTALTSTLQSKLEDSMDINKINTQFHIDLVNDSKKDVKTIVYSSFIDDIPTTFKTIYLTPNSVTEIVLSDTSLQQAFSGIPTPILGN